VTDFHALSGKHIVITRALEQASPMQELLHQYGAVPILYPCIRFTPTHEIDVLDRGIRDLFAGRYDWLIVTSINAAKIVAQRSEAIGFRGEKILARAAAVGPGTAIAAQELFGIEAVITPSEYRANSLVDVIHPLSGRRIFLPQADLAQADLADALRMAGATVDGVRAYHTVIGSGGDNVPRLLHQKAIDAITFTSGSTVRNFLTRLQNEGGSVEDVGQVCIACIGPSTGQEARDAGLSVDIVSREHTPGGLIEGLTEFYSN
jgi:uroporphyrinogen-III synthase